MIQMNKKAYMELIDEDLKFLNKHCPDGTELDHVKLIVCKSIDWLFPNDKSTESKLYTQEEVEALCREQREMCAARSDVKWDAMDEMMIVDEDTILSAPAPEFDIDEK